MRRSHFDYRSYRGRRTAGDWLKWTALVLAVLVVLAVGLLLWSRSLPAQADPQEGTGSGSTQQTGEASKPQPQGEPAQTGDGSQGSDEGAGEQALPEGLLEVGLPALLDGGAADLAEEAGAEGVLVDLKDDRGRLGWQSSQALAAQTMDGVDQGTNRALEQWNRGEVYTAARLSCFRDAALGADMDLTLRTASGYRWQDGEGSHWASPAVEEVEDYLVGLITELARMGFDEIVLSHWGYPTQEDGSLGNLERGERYPEGELDQAVTRFLSRAAQGVEPYGVRLSLSVSAGALPGEGEGVSQAGLTAQAANQYVQRLWMAGDETRSLALLAAAGVDRGEERLVLLSPGEAASSDRPALWRRPSDG